MKRKDFFKTLFGVAAAAVVAPSVLAKEKEEEWRNYWQEQIDEHPEEAWSMTTESFSTEMDEGEKLYALGPVEKDDLCEILKIWEETGMLIYRL
jgi:hypothetical protein